MLLIESTSPRNLILSPVSNNYKQLLENMKKNKDTFYEIVIYPSDQKITIENKEQDQLSLENTQSEALTQRVEINRKKSDDKNFKNSKRNKKNCRCMKLLNRIMEELQRHQFDDEDEEETDNSQNSELSSLKEIKQQSESSEEIVNSFSYNKEASEESQGEEDEKKGIKDNGSDESEEVVGIIEVYEDEEEKELGTVENTESLQSEESQVNDENEQVLPIKENEETNKLLCRCVEMFEKLIEEKNQCRYGCGITTNMESVTETEIKNEDNLRTVKEESEDEEKLKEENQSLTEDSSEPDLQEIEKIIENEEEEIQQTQSIEDKSLENQDPSDGTINEEIEIEKSTNTENPEKTCTCTDLYEKLLKKLATFECDVNGPNTKLKSSDSPQKHSRSTSTISLKSNISELDLISGRSSSNDPNQQKSTVNKQEIAESNSRVAKNNDSQTSNPSRTASKSSSDSRRKSDSSDLNRLHAEKVLVTSSKEEQVDSKESRPEAASSEVLSDSKPSFISPRHSIKRTSICSKQNESTPSEEESSMRQKPEEEYLKSTNDVEIQYPSLKDQSTNTSLKKYNENTTKGQPNKKFTERENTRVRIKSKSTSSNEEFNQRSGASELKDEGNENKTKQHFVSISPESSSESSKLPQRHHSESETTIERVLYRRLTKSIENEAESVDSSEHANASMYNNYSKSHDTEDNDNLSTKSVSSQIPEEVQEKRMPSRNQHERPREDTSKERKSKECKCKNQSSPAKDDRKGKVRLNEEHKDPSNEANKPMAFKIDICKFIKDSKRESCNIQTCKYSNCYKNCKNDKGEFKMDEERTFRKQAPSKDAKNQPKRCTVQICQDFLRHLSVHHYQTDSTANPLNCDKSTQEIINKKEDFDDSEPRLTQNSDTITIEQKDKLATPEKTMQGTQIFSVHLSRGHNNENVKDKLLLQQFKSLLTLVTSLTTLDVPQFLQATESISLASNFDLKQSRESEEDTSTVFKETKQLETRSDEISSTEDHNAQNRPRRNDQDEEVRPKNEIVNSKLDTQTFYEEIISNTSKTVLPHNTKLTSFMTVLDIPRCNETERNQWSFLSNFNLTHKAFSNQRKEVEAHHHRNLLNNEPYWNQPFFSRNSLFEVDSQFPTKLTNVPRKTPESSSSSFSTCSVPSCDVCNKPEFKRNTFVNPKNPLKLSNNSNQSQNLDEHIKEFWRDKERSYWKPIKKETEFSKFISDLHPETILSPSRRKASPLQHFPNRLVDFNEKKVYFVQESRPHFTEIVTRNLSTNNQGKFKLRNSSSEICSTSLERRNMITQNAFFNIKNWEKTLFYLRTTPCFNLEKGARTEMYTTRQCCIFEKHPDTETKLEHKLAVPMEINESTSARFSFPKRNEHYIQNFYSKKQDFKRHEKNLVATDRKVVNLLADFIKENWDTCASLHEPQKLKKPNNKGTL